MYRNFEEYREMVENFFGKEKYNVFFSSVSIFLFAFTRFLKDIFFSLLTNLKKIYNFTYYNYSKKDQKYLVPGDVVKIMDENIKKYYDSMDKKNSWIITNLEYHYTQCVFILENVQDPTLVTGILPEFCEFIRK
jgi:hypothetical protein